MYVHIRYDAFVSLDILEVEYMDFLQIIGLFSECFKVAKFRGLIACAKYLCGGLRLPDLDVKSSVFPDGDGYV